MHMNQVRNIEIKTGQMEILYQVESAPNNSSNGQNNQAKLAISNDQSYLAYADANIVVII